MKKITIIGLAAAMSMFMAVPAGVSAEETKAPAGYVVISAEKFTLGQDFLSVPEKVPFYEGETGADVSERYFGEGNVNSGKPIGAYIESLADKNGKTEANVPAYILDAANKAGKTIENTRTDGKWLSSYDYCDMSGWFYAVNNEFAMESISTYKPVDGDVIRFEFSVYGYGSDIGMDNSSWGGDAALINQADRDELYTAMADVDDNNMSIDEVKTAYENACKTAADISASQADIDKVYQELKTANENAASAAVTTVQEVTEPAVTTTAVSADTSVTSAKPAATSSNSKSSPSTGEKSAAPLIIATCAVFAVGAATKKRSK